MSPPVTSSQSIASSVSGVLLGSTASQRKRMVMEHTVEDPDTCSKSKSNTISEVYDIDEAVIGQGGFGSVRRATLRAAPTVVRAVKTVWKRNLKAESFVRVEINILRRLDHPCICRLLETFEDEKAIYLVLEFIDGRELFDEILELGCFNEKQAAAVMRQVFSALQYCHARKVMHRDMKPDNIMLQRPTVSRTPSASQQLEVKLIDFGLAVISSRGVRGRTGSAVCGSADYLSPEARNGTCLPASDVWSAGMILHALLVGCLPHWTKGPEIILDLDTERYKCVSPQAKDLLRGLLEVDPTKRLDAAAAAAHPWSQGLAKVPGDLTPTLASFVSFHRSAKLRRAALTALAMQLTSKQLRELREQFLLVDRDGDGRISRKELAISMALASPVGAAEEVRSLADAVFDSVYPNNSNQEIEYTEWLAAAVHQSCYQCEEALRAAFRVFDLDGDGYIGQSELQRVLSQTPEEVALCLPEFDTNGDGVLDFEEFKGIFRPEQGGENSDLVLGGKTKLSL